MTLERRYRRLIRLRTAAWRTLRGRGRRHAARRGWARDSVSPAEAADLVRGRWSSGSGPGRRAGAGPQAGDRPAGRDRGRRRRGRGRGAGRGERRRRARRVPADVLVVAAMPGTGVLYTVSSSISGGWRRGLPAAVGCTFGIVPHVLAAMLGLSGLMQAGRPRSRPSAGWAGLPRVHGRVDAARPWGVAGRPAPGRAGRAGVGGGAAGRPGQPAQPQADGVLLRLPPPVPRHPAGAARSPPRRAGCRVHARHPRRVRRVRLGECRRPRACARHPPVLLRWVQRSLGTLVIGFAARLATADR